MPAETAAPAPSVTSAPESNVDTNAAAKSAADLTSRDRAADTAAATEESSPAEIASNDRLKAILADEGLPEEEVAELTKPKDQPNAKAKNESESEKSGGDRAEEGAGDRRAAESDPKAPSSKDQAPEKHQAPKEGDEEPLDEKEHKDNPLLPRVHKLTAQKKALQAQLQRVSQSQRYTPTAADPLADVETPQDFENAIKEYRDLREWAQQNPDGVAKGDVVGQDAKGEPILADRDYSAKEMAGIVARSTRVLDEAAPAKFALLREQHLHEQVARERLPEMFEEGTEPHKFYQDALQELPGLRSVPGMANFIRWAWIGRAEDLKVQSAAGKGANGNGNGKGPVDPKAAPFLRKHAPVAPGMPGARVAKDEAGTRRNGNGNGSDEKVTQAKERVEAGEGEEAEIDFIGSLRASQARNNGEVLV